MFLKLKEHRQVKRSELLKVGASEDDIKYHVHKGNILRHFKGKEETEYSLTDKGALYALRSRFF